VVCFFVTYVIRHKHTQSACARAHTYTRQQYERSDAALLGGRFGYAPDEVNRLWKLFCGSNKCWETMLTETQSEVALFADALHLACFPNEPVRFCSHGLMSGFMQRMFDTLDSNNTCNITFKKFLSVVHTLIYGSQLSRMKLCFRFFDFDGDGIVGASDLSQGIAIITDMLHGVQIAKDEKSRMASVTEVMKRACFEEKIVYKTFNNGPFYLQLETKGSFPKVKRILHQSTRQKGISEEWELLSINEISLKEANDEAIKSAVKRVHFPATLKFRALYYPSIERNEGGRKKKTIQLQLQQFMRVIRMSKAAATLFRLHDADDDDNNELAKRSKCITQNKVLESKQKRRGTFVRMKKPQPPPYPPSPCQKVHSATSFLEMQNS